MAMFSVPPSRLINSVDRSVSMNSPSTVNVAVNAFSGDISVVFSKPVFVGDHVTVDGSITQLSSVFKSAKIDATITNQNSEICVRAKIGVVVR